MEYGKLQGEIAASGHVGQEALIAIIIGRPFNVASVLRVAAGHYTVTLQDGVDPLDCAIVASCTVAPNTVTANNAGVDTDTVKDFLLVNAAGAPVDTPFFFQITRTNIT